MSKKKYVSRKVIEDDGILVEVPVVNQKYKTKFRASSKWKRFRNSFKGKLDPLTMHSIRKGANLHHMDLRPENYTNIENREHFILLNKKSHECLHWVYSYYEKDPGIINRLQNLCETMYEINNGVRDADNRQFNT